MEFTSYVAVKVEVVRELVAKELARLRQHLAEDWRSNVAHRQAARRELCRWFFWLDPLTEDQALAELKKLEARGIWEPGNFYAPKFKRLHVLGRMCDLADNGVVYLSSDDVRSL